MATRVRQEAPHRRRRTTDAAQRADERDRSHVADDVRNDLDDLLDDIDEVLEENAEEFLKAFVQKGGE